MKNLIDYIEECGEGCATPGNTLGMGNPMIPGEPGSPGIPGEPGTEPIGSIGSKQEKKETSKRKKKKITESILDDNVGDKMDEQIIRNWIINQCGENAGKAISFDKDGRIVFPKGAWVRFSIDDKIPEFIKIASCDEMTIRLNMNRDVVIPDGFLPESIDDLEIDIYPEKPSTLSFKTDSLTVSEFTLRGSVSELILPKKFVCDNFNVSSVGVLASIKNISKIKKANFSNEFGANLIRKHLKFQGEIRMNGFGPY